MDSHSAKEQFFKKVEKASEFLEKCIVPFVNILGWLMFFVVIYGVYRRYLIRAPVRWTEELARYLMIWMALLASSICQRRDEHVYITFLTDRIPFIVQRAIQVISRLGILFFFYITFTYGVTMVRNASGQISMGLRISMMYPLLIIPIAALANMAQLLFQIILGFRPKEHVLELEREHMEQKRLKEERLNKRRVEVSL